MSDSSKERAKPGIDFDSRKHFNKACKSTKIKLEPSCVIDYPVGWQSVIGEFIKDIAPIHCTIQNINMKYGYFDVSFTTQTLAKEARIWQAVDRYRRAFHMVCYVCGTYTLHRPGLGWRQICRSCMETDVEGTKTGTWLDTF